ncbi:BatA domain-containing protein [Aquimarina sp. M1]
MFFLNPTYLWAFLGLLIPLAIHFWSKKEGKTIKVGSTKLLSESDSKQSRSIQLNEFFLLILRMALISLLVLIISEGHIKKKATTIPIIYVVEPSLIQDERVLAILDTLEIGESLRLLQPGLPEFDKDPLGIQSVTTPNYWQLVKEMETLQTDSVVVFTKALINGIKGRRPGTYKHITWIPVESEESITKNIKATKKKDSLHLIAMTSNRDQLFFKKELIPIDDNRFKFTTTKDSVIFPLNGKEEMIEFSKEIPTKVLLHYQDSLIGQKKYIEASLRAISKYLDRQITIEVDKELDGVDLSAFDLVVWLSIAKIPNTGSKLLVYQPDDLANTIIEEGSSSRIFYLTEALNTTKSVDRNLSEQLLKLFDFHQDIEAKVQAYDKRTIAVSELRPLAVDQVVTKKQVERIAISKWLWFIFGVMLVIERSIAKLRKQ